MQLAHAWFRFRSVTEGELKLSLCSGDLPAAGSPATLRAATDAGDLRGGGSGVRPRGTTNLARPFTAGPRLEACLLAADGQSPAASAVSAPCSSWVYDELTLPRDPTSRLQNAATPSPNANTRVVRAVIETATPPPPPQQRSRASPPSVTSPPNTAPLSNKFSRTPPVPQNLLRLQRKDATGSEAESSSMASTNEIFVVEDDGVDVIAEVDSHHEPDSVSKVCPPAPKPRRSMAIANSLANWKNNNNSSSFEEKRNRVGSSSAASSTGSSSSPRFKLSLSLGKKGGRMVKFHHHQQHAGDKDDDNESTSSSADSASSPLKKKSACSKPLPPSSLLIRPKGETAGIVRRGAEVPDSARQQPQHQPLKLDLAGKSKKCFFSSGSAQCGGGGGDSTCSSAMSSLESIRSNASDVVSTESGAVSSVSSSEQSCSEAVTNNLRPSLDFVAAPVRCHHHHHHHRQSLNRPSSAKFQVLSPISDKSQEQSSENQPTPKASPNDIEDSNANPCPSSTAAAAADASSAEKTEMSANNNAIGPTDDGIAKALDVPWDVPKLKRRLLSKQNNLNQGQLRGSDSGISMTSAQEQEIRELLNVPWDMPKLRKKTEQMLLNSSAGRPNSMPAAPAAASATASAASSAFSLGRPSSDATTAAAVTGPSLELRLQNIPPPPPGFETAGDEFYLGRPGSECGNRPVTEKPQLDNRPGSSAYSEDEDDGEKIQLRKGATFIWVEKFAPVL